ncbi:MAG: DUF4860 domain-containing protein [Marinisporobacter sp.]|nr:DUF4860 domain-containing protein [Marinisporobacter sp.]
MKKNGFTLIEILIVLLIMTILGTIILSLVKTSQNLYQNIYKDADAEMEARIALSYVMVKIRQNDVKDGIEVDDKNNKIIIKESKIDKTKNDYEIYFELDTAPAKGGYLKEKQGGKVQDIAKIQSFTISESKKEETDTSAGVSINKIKERMITVTVTYKDKFENIKSLTENYTIRCVN